MNTKMNEKIIKCFKLPEILIELRKTQANREYFFKQIHINELRKIELKNKIKAGDRQFEAEIKSIG